MEHCQARWQENFIRVTIAAGYGGDCIIQRTNRNNGDIDLEMGVVLRGKRYDDSRKSSANRRLRKIRRVRSRGRVRNFHGAEALCLPGGYIVSAQSSDGSSLFKKKNPSTECDDGNCAG